MRRLISIFMPILIAVIAMITAQNSLQSIDEERFESLTDSDRYFLPNVAATKAVSMGQQLFVADVFWLRLVLVYSDFITDCSEDDISWLNVMLDTVSSLDPKWRTAYFYGGTFLSVCEDVAGSDKLFKKGHEELPKDSFFPFSLSMNALLVHKDKDLARQWMLIAASMDSSPDWYKTLAAELTEETSSREASMMYLQEQLSMHTDPAIRALLQAKYNRKLHDQRVEEIAQLRGAFEKKMGRPINSVAELRIPFEDPFADTKVGSNWILSVDGTIRSQFIDKEIETKEKALERDLMKMKP